MGNVESFPKLESTSQGQVADKTLRERSLNVVFPPDEATPISSFARNFVKKSDPDIYGTRQRC
jgi:hypothetical protein